MQSTDAKHGVATRFFGTHEFSRLWQITLITSMGDWIGLLSLAIAAASIWEEQSGIAVIIVVGSRLVASLIFGLIGGVLSDRYNRYYMMIFCDIGRSLIYLSVPFLGNLGLLVLTSFLLEILYMLWIPSKEALVPTLLPKDKLARGNGLSSMALYATFPVATGIVYVSTDADWFGIFSSSVLGSFMSDSGFWLTSMLFATSVFLTIKLSSKIGRGKILAIRQGARSGLVKKNTTILQAVGLELQEGYKTFATVPTVRNVVLTMAAAANAIGILFPIGFAYVEDVLKGGDAGYLALQLVSISGGGLGGAAVFCLSKFVDTHIRRLSLFVVTTFGSLVSLLIFTFSSAWVGVIIASVLIGACAGFTFAMGLTILQSTVSETRLGRTVSIVFSLHRVSLLISFCFGYLLYLGSQQVLGDSVDFLGLNLVLPGVRWTLWVAAGLLCLNMVFIIRLLILTLSGKTTVPNQAD